MLLGVVLDTQADDVQGLAVVGMVKLNPTGTISKVLKRASLGTLYGAGADGTADGGMGGSLLAVALCVAFDGEPVDRLATF